MSGVSDCLAIHEDFAFLNKAKESNDLEMIDVNKKHTTKMPANTLMPDTFLIKMSTNVNFFRAISFLTKHRK